MNPRSLGDKLVKGIGLAGAIGVFFGVAYIFDCRRFATTNEGIQGCYAFGAALAGVGAGVNGIRSGGLQEGLWTYNPYLHEPKRTTRRTTKPEPTEPEV